MTRHAADSLARDLVRATLSALLLALAIAGGFRVVGVGPYPVVAVNCAIFSLVLSLGFRLARPLLRVTSEGGRSPLSIAMASTARMAALYTGLLAVCVALTHLATGLDLIAQPTIAVVTYLIGFTCTVSIHGLRLTESLVRTERLRASAEAERQRHVETLEAARALQVGLLPRVVPEAPGVALAWDMRTAETVGGDFLDVFTAPDGRIHGVIGDATGHGMRAGMVCVAAKSLFRTGSGEPLQDLVAMGEGIRALGLPNTAMALTLWTLEGRKLTLAHAGMPPPLWWRARTREVEVLPLKAPPVGQLRRPLVATLELDLEPGDTLLFASDGLAERMDGTDRMLGYGALPALFATRAEGAPSDILQGLWEAAEVHAQGAPLSDDLSLLVLRV